MTLGQVITNNPSSYPYDMGATGFHESQQYYLAWYYGSGAYDRLESSTLGHNSYLVYTLDGMRKDGVDLSKLTVSEMDQMSLDNASFWFKADTVALVAYGAYNAYNYAKTVKANSPTTNTQVVDNPVDDLAGDIKEWIGNDGRVITNPSGDKIFLSENGTRRVRFDINHTSPHSNPHGHVEQLVNGKWIKSGPLYPVDVPHN